MSDPKSEVLINLMNLFFPFVSFFQTFSENNMKSFEFKSLQETLDEIKGSLDPSNLRYVASTEIEMFHCELV